MSTALERRYRDTLRIVGTGTIVLGVWEMFKLGTVIAMGLVDYMLGEGASAFTPFLVGFVVCVAGVAVYVGFTARSEGLGARKGSLHLVFTAVLILYNLLGTAGAVMGGLEGQYTVVEVLAYVVTTVACVYVYVDLIATTVRLRRLVGSGASTTPGDSVQKAG